VSGKPTGTKLLVNEDFYNLMSNRLREMGWDSVRHFVLGSKLPFSCETAGRVFKPNPYKGIEAYTVAIVAMYLEYSLVEIKHILQTFTNDTLICQLIGDAGEGANISKEELGLLEILHPLSQQNPDIYRSVGDMVTPIARAMGIDITESVKKLGRATIKRSCRKE